MTRSYGSLTWAIHMCDMTQTRRPIQLLGVSVSYWMNGINCRHDSSIRVTCLIPTFDMPHSYVWHDSFIRVTCRIHTCDEPYSYVWHASFIPVTWSIHTCDVPHPYVWRDSFTYAPTHLGSSKAQPTIRDMTHSYAWHVSLISVTHDSSIRVTWLIHIYTHTPRVEQGTTEYTVLIYLNDGVTGGETVFYKDHDGTYSAVFSVSLEKTKNRAFQSEQRTLLSVRWDWWRSSLLQRSCQYIFGYFQKNSSQKITHIYIYIFWETPKKSQYLFGYFLDLSKYDKDC